MYSGMYKLSPFFFHSYCTQFLNPMSHLCFPHFRHFWGLAIDTVAVINLVLAVGLSVDYAAHVAHSFMIKTGTRDERMVEVGGWARYACVALGF